MLILHHHRSGPRRVELRIHGDEATVADLAHALGETTPLVVDGQLRSAASGLARLGLGEGSEVGGPLACPPLPRSGRAPAAVHVVAGVDAAGRRPLMAGEWVLGRDRDTADVVLDSTTVSARHVVVRVGPEGGVELRDLGSRNGTAIDGQPCPAWRRLPPGGRARIGGLSVHLAPTIDDDRHPGIDAGPAGGRPVVVHHRPPRATPPPAPDPVMVPRPPAASQTRPTLAVASALLPAVAGLAIVLITGNWLFALLPLLGPLLAITAWWHSRRQATKVGRRDRLRHAAEVAVLRTELTAAVATERRRRREVLTDVAEVVRRSRLPSVRLWERRPHDADFLRLVAGEADVAWVPPTTGGATFTAESASPLVAAAMAAASVLRDVPVELDLSAGGVVGVVGPPDVARAVAASLVLQAAVLHGPADLEIVVAAGAEAGDAWSWTSWLPHVRDRHGDRRLVFEGGTGASGLVGLLDGPRPEVAVRLVVIDDEAVLGARRSPARALLGGAAGAVAGVVVATRRDRLPASCTTVVTLEGRDGAATVDDLRAGRRQRGVVVAGLSVARADGAARSLARFDDPDVAVAAVARQVGLTDLLGAGATDPVAIAAAWAASWDDVGLSVPLGMDADGPVPVDLVVDGPHALVAGTTGAGKSELLRSWVVALAARVDPRLLSIVLVDYKGGAAFDACARLPHTAAVVTDLDATLGERALRGLDAELRRRERLLRQAGAADLVTLRRSGGDAPTLPRLLVVVDEFATLAAELPGFLDALVGVAQRGRSLGVHLVLATQRPAGVVNDAIRANTNLRIALRVQDAHDAHDVIGSDLAARLPRHRPGAAVLRLGPNELVTVQAAHSSAPVDRADRSVVEIVTAASPAAALAGGIGPHVGATGPTQLEQVVAACRAAAATLGLSPVAAPWTEPLPASLTLDGLARLPEAATAEPGTTSLWLADDPDHQRRQVGGWDLAEGNLAVYGTRGSGTTTTLVAAAVALACRYGPDELHVYAIDASGGGGLDVLAALPHTAAVVRPGEGERLQRLLGRLTDEFERRRAGGGAGPRPRIVLLVDGLATLVTELDQPGGLAVVERLQRFLGDGPGLGLHTAFTAERPGGVRPAMVAGVAQRLVLALADPVDARTLGAPVVGGPPGRGVDLVSGLVVQVARAEEATVRGLVAGAGVAGPGWPRPVGSLADHVAWEEVCSGAWGHGRPWLLPLGMGAHALEPAAVSLHPAEHLLVAGPARSGRTTTLLTLATALRAARPDVTVVAVLPRPSPLAEGPVDRVLGVADLYELTDLALGARTGGPLVVLVDDAELVDDGAGVLERLLLARAPDVHVVAAGRADALRTSYGAWLRLVRQSRAGLLLAPDIDLDGDLLSVRLPRRSPALPAPGRGYLVGGAGPVLIQVARPPASPNILEDLS